MRELRLVLSMMAVVLVTLVLAPAAHAQATRTWVSGVGDDVNPCSRTAPCKTFAGAISKTAAGGEISVLDPGGFGAVTITKSITLNGDGTLASILASGTNGINVNGAGIKVIIRNLSINGAGLSPGLVGINFVQGAQLTVENVTIYGFQGGSATGIRAALTASGEMLVKDTNITNCSVGVHLQTSAGQLLATLDNVRLENMTTHGLEATAGSSFVTVKHSTINNNNLDGARSAGAATVITLEDNMLAFNNGTAANAAVAGARIRISNNTIVNNNVGVGIVAGAFVETANNNRIDGNGSSAVPNDTFTVQ